MAWVRACLFSSRTLHKPDSVAVAVTGSPITQHWRGEGRVKSSRLFQAIEDPVQKTKILKCLHSKRKRKVDQSHVGE